METFTLRITMPDGTERRRFNCTLYKGKVAFAMRAKSGNYNEYVEYYFPFINVDLLAENGLTQAAAKEILEKNPATAVLDERIYNSMVVLGENKGGKICINETAEKAAEEERRMRAKETVIPFVWGIFGLRIGIQLPKKTWNLVSSCAQYHAGEEDDREAAETKGYYDYPTDMLKGWFYSPEAIDILVEAGYKVTYQGHSLTSSEEIAKIDKEIKATEEEASQKQKLYQEERADILAAFARLRDKAEMVTREEAQEVSKLAPLHFYELGFCGPDIYGGGIWLYDTDKALYYVRNNGTDGDDWSLNNFPTGGAGAICTKVNKPDAEIDEFLTRAKKFCKSIGYDTKGD